VARLNADTSYDREGQTTETTSGIIRIASMAQIYRWIAPAVPRGGDGLILALLRSRYWATWRRLMISAEVEAAKAAKRSIEQAKNTDGSNGRNVGQILGIALLGLAAGATRTKLLESKEGQEGQEISAIPRPSAQPSKGEREGTRVLGYCINFLFLSR
jgi:hypothetical protein